MSVVACRVLVETAIELSVFCEGPIQAITRKVPPKGG